MIPLMIGAWATNFRIPFSRTYGSSIRRYLVLLHFNNPTSILKERGWRKKAKKKKNSVFMFTTLKTELWETKREGERKREKGWENYLNSEIQRGR
jgi:hypothetical protein